MATFLLTSIPIQAHTTNPHPFAARLVERGHRVLQYAGATFHDQIRAVGVEPVPYRRAEDFSAVDLAERWPDIMGSTGPAAIRRAFAEIFVGMAGERTADIVEIVENNGVDAILADGIVFGGRLAAELTGVPWATFGDGPLPYMEPDTPPFGPALRYRPDAVGRLRNRVVAAVGTRLIFGPAQQRYDQLRTELGLPTGLRVVDSMESPMLHLQGCTPGFEYPRRSVPAHMHYVGALGPYPAVAWTPPSWWPELIADPRPLVVVSQGSLRADPTELIVPAVRALADLDVQVLVTTGRASCEQVAVALGGTVPGNVRLLRFAPYDEVFRHADVFVTNGGYTGVTLALSHGVALVQAGMTEEKPEIGRRVDYAGCGIDLRTSRPKPDAVRGAVQRVLGEPSFRAAAGAIQREMSAHDAGLEGARLLEQLAASRSPVLRTDVATAAG
jgi:UDP:flavonoid glycosyltransferase YjiC (YdhE family)